MQGAATTSHLLESCPLESRSATSMGCSALQALPVPAAQKAELALMMLEELFGCPSAIIGLCPSLQSRLSEGLLFTADRFGLTVNDKPKSLCTAIQPLLHPPGYTWELHDSEWETNVLHSVHRVLAGNITFPLTTNPSGRGKKILPPGETEIKS